MNQQISIFDLDNENSNSIMTRISSEEALDFILPRHYAGRSPMISIAYGWYINGEIVAACTFGKPANHVLCEQICGEEYKNCVYELNRLVRTDDLTEPLSKFVSFCLRDLKPNNWIIVSYSDLGMNHHGYIYQACNFLYTGMTESRLDRYYEGKHQRHAYDGGGLIQDENQFTLCDIYSDVDSMTNLRGVRTPKFRYIYFCTSDKKLKKKWQKSLKYDILPYPKGDNKNYKLGTIYKQKVVPVDSGCPEDFNLIPIEEE